MRIDVRINMRVDVHIHVHDGPEDPADEPSRDQSQQSEGEDDGKDEQTEAGTDPEKDHTETQTSAPIVLSELALHPPSWPADGFADDDPATTYMVDILHSFDMRSVRLSAAEDFMIYPPQGPNDREGRGLRAFDQLTRRRIANSSNSNFLIRYHSYVGDMVGKVYFSKTGLTIILQALRSVLKNNGDIPSLSQHVDRLNAGNSAMIYPRPVHLESSQFYHAYIDPFAPEGARTAVAALQAAVRNSSYNYALFRAHIDLNTIPHGPGQFAFLAVYDSV